MLPVFPIITSTLLKVYLWEWTVGLVLRRWLKDLLPTLECLGSIPESHSQAQGSRWWLRFWVPATHVTVPGWHPQFQVLILAQSSIMWAAGKWIDNKDLSFTLYSSCSSTIKIYIKIIDRPFYSSYFYKSIQTLRRNYMTHKAYTQTVKWKIENPREIKLKSKEYSVLVKQPEKL